MRVHILITERVTTNKGSKQLSSRYKIFVNNENPLYHLHSFFVARDDISPLVCRIAPLVILFFLTICIALYSIKSLLFCYSIRSLLHKKELCLNSTIMLNILICTLLENSYIIRIISRCVVVHIVILRLAQLTNDGKGELCYGATIY